MCISPKEEDPTQIETECSLAEYRQENDHLKVSKQALKNTCAVLFLKYDFKFLLMREMRTMFTGFEPGQMFVTLCISEGKS